MKQQMKPEEARTFMKVSGGISKQDLHTKYLELAKEFHPDISKHKNAAELFKKLNTAYDILKPLAPEVSKYVRPKEAYRPPPKEFKEWTPPPTAWKRSMAGNLYRMFDETRYIIIKNKFDKFDYMTVDNNGDKLTFHPSYATEQEVADFIDKLIKVGVQNKR